MKHLIRWGRKQAKRWIAIAVIVLLLSFTRLPVISAPERMAIAQRFHFTRQPLPALPAGHQRFLRNVHPSLETHAGWISAVGAAIALNDLDGDGLANDACYVDTRSDRVIVAPVPGTGERYQPFELVPQTLAYASSTMAPMGCLPGDMNEDGQLDVLVYYWGRTSVAFLHQSLASSATQVDGLSPQSYQEQEIIPDGELWYTNAATFADLDGDGHNDLIIGNYFQDNARILDVKATGQEEMQHSMTRAFNGGRDRILRWQPNFEENAVGVTFQEVEDVLPPDIALGWTLAIAAADLDGDLLPEIYFANDFGPDRLLHNRSRPGQLAFANLKGRKGLTTPNSKVLGNDSFKGMGVDFADLNHDGWLDFYVSNIAAEFALEESHFLFTSTGNVEQMQQGIAPYVDRSESLGLSRSGWGWETKFGDFDNDGEPEALQATGFRQGHVNRWPELHELAMSNDDLLSHPNSWFQFQAGDDLSGHQPNPFYVKASDGRYYDLAQALGLDDPLVTRGIATADVDGDGDLDFAIANQWQPSYFYCNDNPESGAFLELRLLQTPTGHNTAIQTSQSHMSTVMGSSVIGAQATVSLPDGRQLVAQVDGGNGHSGARSSELHFGLGELDQTTSLPVDIMWRDRSGQVRQTSLLLSPGRHTVLLDEMTKSASSAS